VRRRANDLLGKVALSQSGRRRRASANVHERSRRVHLFAACDPDRLDADRHAESSGRSSHGQTRLAVIYNRRWAVRIIAASGRTRPSALPPAVSIVPAMSSGGCTSRRTCAAAAARRSSRPVVHRVVGRHWSFAVTLRLTRRSGLDHLTAVRFRRKQAAVYTLGRSPLSGGQRRVVAATKAA
jgi:hypothetical protein